jgi:crotonobetainyl-CoA:carnitine CoA-transferase CaiB-like acyl-CoA transferase
MNQTKQQKTDGLLSGVRVLCFEHMLQGPLASLLLRGMGADVIKIEPLTGSVERNLTGRGQWIEGRSVLDLVVNRGKRSLAINLKHESAREILNRLLATADILTHNFRPGVMERLGLGYEELHERFPRLVYGAASGYGEGGPYVDRPGQDLLVQAMTGMMDLNGRRDDPPTPLGSTMIDVHSGTLLALSVCAGLLKRERTGEGTKVGVDLLASGLHLQFEPFHYALNSDQPMERPRTGLADPYHHAPYGVYPATDGHVAISTNDMSALVDSLSSVGTIDVPLDMRSPETFAARDEIYPKIAAVTGKRSVAELMTLFREKKVWAEPVRAAGKEIADNEQVAWRGLVEEIGGEAKVRSLRIPVETFETGPAAYSPTPRIGQDSDDILMELGFSKGEITQFTEAGVIGAASEE